MIHNLAANEFNIPFDSLPYYLTVTGRVEESQAMRGAPIHKVVRIKVYSRVHKQKEYELPTGFHLDYWNENTERAMQAILSRVVSMFGLRAELRYN